MSTAMMAIAVLGFLVWGHHMFVTGQSMYAGMVFSVISMIIAIGGYYSNTELSYVLAFTFFIVLMFVRPRGIFAR